MIPKNSFHAAIFIMDTASSSGLMATNFHVQSAETRVYCLNFKM